MFCLIYEFFSLCRYRCSSSMNGSYSRSFESALNFFCTSKLFGSCMVVRYDWPAFDAKSLNVYSPLVSY